MRLTWRPLITSVFIFAAWTAGHAQNQINPGNQIRWPMPSCASQTAAYLPGPNQCQDISHVPPTSITWPLPSCSSSTAVYIPGTNQCYDITKQPPSNITWPSNCTPGQVYSPALNTCVPQGGTANNPAGQLYDVQINGGSNMGVSSPNRMYTNANGDFINQASVLSPLPRVNVQNPMFAGGADKTGTNDAAPAINAAVAWALANPQGKTYPTVYLAQGTYQILSTIRIPCYIHFVGAGRDSTVIQVGTSAGANYNAITVNSTLPGNVLLNVWTCPGSLEDFTVNAPGGHLYTGTMVEIGNAAGYFIRNIRVSNGGGRGIVTYPNTERFAAYNTQADTVRLPVVAIGNEERWFNTNVSSAGSSDNGGYCHSPANCPGGVFPNGAWTQAQTVNAMTANGTTLTLVINGGNNSASNNGQSPLVVGHWFQLGGATNNPALNGFYQITGVQNTTPTGTQYTITAATTITDSETPSSLTYKPAILPEFQGGAIVAGGAEVELYGGSLKAMWYAPAIQITQHFGGKIEGFYLEGFPTNGQPHENPAIIDIGLPFTTTTTASLPTANNSTVTVTSTDWAYCYANDPQDIQLASSCAVWIYPADYAPGNSSPSTAVPGINRNQFEYANLEFSGLTGPSAKMLARFQGSGGLNVPNTTVWPAGSIISVQPGADYGPMQISDNHLSTINDPGTNWSSYCSDGTILTPLINLTCTIAAIGPVPNGYSTLSRAQTATRGSAIVGGIDVFNSNEWWGNATIKTFGSSAVTIQSTLKSMVAETPAAVSPGQYLQNQYPYVAAVVSPVDSSAGFLSYTNTGVDTYANNTQALYWSLVSPSGTDPNIGGQSGGSVNGHQYANSHCFYDMGVSTASPHTLNRLCLKGGPNNTGANAGITYETWNGAAWFVNYSITNNGTTSNYFANTGQGTIGNLKNSNQTVTTAAQTFNGPPEWWDFFQWYNGSADTRVGCGWSINSNTAANVTPTGFSYTYACNGYSSLTVPLQVKYNLPAGSVFQPPAQGRSTLVAGTVTVSNAAAGWNGGSTIYTLTNCNVNGTPGILSVGTVVNGTSFVINSTNSADTSQVCWWIH